MSENLPIAKERFIKRLVDLCVKNKLPGLPKDELDQHIILKSVVLTLGQHGVMTEKEINEKLEYWISHVDPNENVDRVTLRRRLVDVGYLTRAKDGSSYQVSLSGSRPQFFEQAIDQVDVVAAIASAREEIVRRKKEYLQKAKSQGEDK